MNSRATAIVVCEYHIAIRRSVTPAKTAPLVLMSRHKSKSSTADGIKIPTGVWVDISINIYKPPGRVSFNAVDQDDRN